MGKTIIKPRREDAMDQIQIGKFIAAERKRKGCTQRQLGELLGITDKTISKWETGKGFPEVSLLLPLCEELEITVNELLAGERVSEEEYQRKAEETMVNLVKEAQESRKKFLLSLAVAVLTVLAAAPLMVISDTFDMEPWLRWVLIGIGLAILAGGIAVACVLDRDAGAFECPRCHARFVPTMKAYILGPHTFTRRMLRCPKCGAVRYCKHAFGKSFPR